MRRLVIYGMEECPYTRTAKKSYASRGDEVDYRDVLANPQEMQTMLRITGGIRKVPVIVEGDNHTIGYGGT